MTFTILRLATRRLSLALLGHAVGEVVANARGPGRWRVMGPHLVPAASTSMIELGAVMSEIVRREDALAPVLGRTGRGTRLTAIARRMAVAEATTLGAMREAVEVAHREFGRA